MPHEAPSVISRKKTRQVLVGGVPIGGDAPVAIQSMTSTYTYDVEIRRLAEAGCDIVRVAVPDKRDTDALPAILDQSPVPIVADVHFHFQRALEAVEAGVHKIRLNPGNIKDRKQVDRVIAACRERRIPIRVGVNEGSVVERPCRRNTGTMTNPHWRRAGSRRSPILGMQERNVA
jgi:(E)-4-hydroxy-3-methylbut-2-enyl-diphosphate synthase